MKVTGTIKNVVDFGAFVDIGLHETGLIHVSELSDSFVSDPMEVIKVGDVKEFTIIDLDVDRRRISLSLKSDAMNRLGQGGGKRAAAGDNSGDGSVRRVVRAVRPGEKRQPVGAGAGRSAGGYNRDNAGGNRGSSGGRGSYGSDDGMSYNPFAALLKNKK